MAYSPSLVYCYFNFTTPGIKVNAPFFYPILNLHKIFYTTISLGFLVIGFFHTSTIYGQEHLEQNMVVSAQVAIGQRAMVEVRGKDGKVIVIPH